MYREFMYEGRQLSKKDSGEGDLVSLVEKFRPMVKNTPTLRDTSCDK